LEGFVDGKELKEDSLRSLKGEHPRDQLAKNNDNQEHNPNGGREGNPIALVLAMQITCNEDGKSNHAYLDPNVNGDQYFQPVFNQYPELFNAMCLAPFLEPPNGHFTNPCEAHLKKG